MMAGITDQSKRLKLVVVGDGYVGKTSLLYAYKDKQFRSVSVATVFDTYVNQIHFEGVTYTVTMVDTAGSEDYARLRSMNYINTNCFILCYSATSKASFANIQHTWVPEIRRDAPNSSIILVATKIDTRSETDDNHVNHKQGLNMKRQIGAVDLIACSAKEYHNVELVFETALKAAITSLSPNKEPSKCCTIV